jgi:protein required for attachment to host cells
MKTTWVVVAESARARIFSLSGIGGKLRELENLTHPESRLHDSELTSGRPGRTSDSHGRRHGLEQAMDPHEREAHTFARQVAQHIDRGRREASFDSLVLIAPPKFLGELRTNLSKPTRSALSAELDKNLVEADLKSIERHLTALMQR